MKNIRVINKQGKYPGKNIVIMAGAHGDEVCGVKAFNELISRIEIEKGNVVFIYANLEAQKQNKRFIEENLNRCFLDEQPEEIKNTLEGKTAKAIIPYLKKADVLLDVHSSDNSDNLKFLICEEDCKDLVDALSPEKIILGIDDAQKGSSDGYMYNQGKPGICIECGLHNSKESEERAKSSIINFLKRLEAIKGKPGIYPDKKFFRVEKMYKNKFGEFKLEKEFKDFDNVKKGTFMGTDGNKKIYSDKDCNILFPYEPKEIGNECFVILRRLG